jgi:hypothetical protein
MLQPSTRCRGQNCGAPITFVWLESSHRRHPIDPEPSEKGNMKLLGLHGEDPKAHLLSRSQREEALDRGVWLYISHYATCPDAEAFRRRAR